MVMFHIKRDNAKNHFLFETKLTQKTDDFLKEIAELHNMRIKVQRLSTYCLELGKHGPIRPEETRGLSGDTNISELDVNAYGVPSCPDEHGYRTGVPPAGQAAQVLIRTSEEAFMAVSDNLVASKKVLTKEICKEHLDKLYGATMIAYPGYHRLPAYDPARMDLENREEIDGRTEYQDIIDPSDASIWWAGKELTRGKILSDQLGKNEKTKIIARLQHKEAGAPVREPRIDQETHKAMMSHYHKKQEENKKMAEDDDDSYLTSEWANNKSLKKALTGSGNIRI